VELEDEWLRDCIIDSMELDLDSELELWIEFVSRGRVHRLARRPDAKQQVEGVLRGDPWVPGEHVVWAKALGESELLAMEGIALAAAIGVLHEALDALEEDEGGDLVFACERRDHLQGVLLLLREAGGGGSLRGVLRGIDEIMTVEEVPTFGAESRQLQAARPLEWPAWWVLPVCYDPPLS
jgi:hypothetical protein